MPSAAQTLDAVRAFVAGHHVLTLATSGEAGPQCAPLFYAYDPERICFIVASETKTAHIRNLERSAAVAVAIALETKTVGKIEGLQIEGIMRRSAAREDAECYFGAFPYARVMRPTLWRIDPLRMKLTDNRLGFGKKLCWERGGET